MSHDNDALNQAYHRYQTDLAERRTADPVGVPGVYGLSGVFEDVVEQFERSSRVQEALPSGGHALSAAAQPKQLCADRSHRHLSGPDGLASHLHG